LKSVAQVRSRHVKGFFHGSSEDWHLRRHLHPRCCSLVATSRLGRQLQPIARALPCRAVKSF
jgi:hypothetical protein